MLTTMATAMAKVKRWQGFSFRRRCDSIGNKSKLFLFDLTVAVSNVWRWGAQMPRCPDAQLEVGCDPVGVGFWDDEWMDDQDCGRGEAGRVNQTDLGSILKIWRGWRSQYQTWMDGRMDGCLIVAQLVQDTCLYQVCKVESVV